MLKDFKIHRNETRAADLRLEYFKNVDSVRNAVLHVLVDLCTQLDSNDHGEGINEDDL